MLFSMLRYLPFENKFLEACRFIDPRNKLDPSFEQWVKTVASYFPKEINASDQQSLEIESRLQQTNGTCSDDSSTDDIHTHLKKWSEKCPTLARLAKLVMIIPHGNAEIERVFSMLSDIVTKKRKALSPTLCEPSVLLNRS